MRPKEHGVLFRCMLQRQKRFLMALFAPVYVARLFSDQFCNQINHLPLVQAGRHDEALPGSGALASDSKGPASLIEGLSSFPEATHSNSTGKP